MSQKKAEKSRASTMALERRAVIADLHLNGKTEREIAKLVGISAPSVHGHIEKIRDDLRERSIEAIETVSAYLLAHHWRNYYELLADYRKSKEDQPVVRTEIEFALELQPDGTHKRVPVTERVIRTVTPGQPATSLMSEAEACLDKIAKLQGAYKPTKIASTTPAGDAAAPLVGPTTNYIYIDITKDPALMTEQELDAIWKASDAQQLRVQEIELLEGTATVTEGSSESAKRPESESTRNGPEEPSID